MRSSCGSMSCSATCVGAPWRWAKLRTSRRRVALSDGRTIAHSMGNRGVGAVNRIAAKAQRRSGKPFGQVILAAAAADVDADVFRQLSAAYAEVASRTTLHDSKH